MQHTVSNLEEHPVNLRGTRCAILTQVLYRPGVLYQGFANTTGVKYLCEWGLIVEPGTLFILNRA